MMRLARAFDDAATSASRFARLATAVAKYWVCKRAAAAGGGGARVPRRQRLRRGVDPAAALSRGAAERHLGGLGQRHLSRRAARDGARAPSRSTRSSPRSRWRAAPTGASTAGSSACGPISAVATIPSRAPATSSSGWRSPCRASLLVRHADPTVADAFCASRLGGAHGLAFGTLPADVDARGIVERARPQL